MSAFDDFVVTVMCFESIMGSGGSGKWKVFDLNEPVCGLFRRSPRPEKDRECVCSSAPNFARRAHLLARFGKHET